MANEVFDRLKKVSSACYSLPSYSNALVTPSSEKDLEINLIATQKDFQTMKKKEFIQTIQCFFTSKTGMEFKPPSFPQESEKTLGRTISPDGKTMVVATTVENNKGVSERYLEV